MSRYANCPHCKGYGYFSCEHCTCKICHGKGKINCSNCMEGSVPCLVCNSTGQIRKKGLIFSHSISCPECKGAKRLHCPACKGSHLVSCPECKGTGKDASCKVCGGTQRIQCGHCKGSGKMESEFFKSLKNLPVDRLKFEYEKRQREIQQVQTKISRLSREEEDIREDYYRDKSENPGAYIHGGYPIGLDSIPREIGQLEKRIGEIEDDMEAINQVLNTKWK